MRDWKVWKGVRRGGDQGVERNAVCKYTNSWEDVRHWRS